MADMLFLWKDCYHSDEGVYHILSSDLLTLGPFTMLFSLPPHPNPNPPKYLCPPNEMTFFIYLYLIFVFSSLSLTAQSLGKVSVDVRHLGVDMVTIVGHKFGCPKGVAALYMREGNSYHVRPSSAATVYTNIY